MDVTSLTRIERLNYLLGGALVLASVLFLSREQALGMLVGVVLGCVNFSLIRRIVERWVAGAVAGGGASGFFFIPKMGALMAAVFLALRFLPISAPYLAIGFSVFLVSIAVETARSLTNPTSDESNEDAA